MSSDIKRGAPSRCLPCLPPLRGQHNPLVWAKMVHVARGCCAGSGRVGAAEGPRGHRARLLSEMRCVLPYFPVRVSTAHTPSCDACFTREITQRQPAGRLGGAGGGDGGVAGGFGSAVLFACCFPVLSLSALKSGCGKVPSLFSVTREVAWGSGPSGSTMA